MYITLSNSKGTSPTNVWHQIAKQHGMYLCTTLHVDSHNVVTVVAVSYLNLIATTGLRETKGLPAE